MSSDTNLFISATRSAPALRVEGGRMVGGGGGGYQINGQQLQLQLDQLTGAMTDMMMEDDEMEVEYSIHDLEKLNIHFMV